MPWPKGRPQGRRQVVADHNDPNAVNSIFSDVDVSAADLYDMFGFPSDNSEGGEKVVIALTFASVPETGVLDTDMLYRVQLHAAPRVVQPAWNDFSLDNLTQYFEAVKDKYLGELNPCEIRVRVDETQKAKVEFKRFREADFSFTVATNESVTFTTSGARVIQVFVGGRDDAFFNDLPGFFRSINYAPQFYHVPHTMPDVRELKIPKTFLELEGNDLFNYDPQLPRWGHGIKKELPAGPLTWSGNRFRKDPDGNFRFVYSGEDARAGQNCNAIILELPLSYLTATPAEH